MSTRGFLGFVADGAEKITYNHFDSYPEGLGTHVLGWLRTAVKDMDALRRAATDLRVVGNDTEPTAEDIERLRPFANTNVGAQNLRDWYCLLRETQGDPGAILRAGVMLDASDFPMDSLFAEYGYLVDLDAGTFEAYEGFQREAHDRGRFSGRATPADCPSEYHPCALVASWPLEALPADDDLVAAYGEGEV